MADRSLNIVDFMEELVIHIKRITLEPSSSTLMFPKDNVHYGLLNPEIIRASKLKDNVCCILGGRDGNTILDRNMNADEMSFIIPVIGFFFFPTSLNTDNALLRYEYHFIQQLVDLFQNEINNWSDTVFAGLASFSLNTQINISQPWYYDTFILPPYYCCVANINVTIEGSCL